MNGYEKKCDSGRLKIEIKIVVNITEKASQPQGSTVS